MCPLHNIPFTQPLHERIAHARSSQHLDFQRDACPVVVLEANTVALNRVAVTLTAITSAMTMAIGVIHE